MESSPLPIEGSNYESLADTPLFGLGTANPRGYGVNTVIIAITCIFVFATTISAFIPHPTVAEVFFLFCIIMICSSHLTLMYWYRQGDLDPKFMKLIYFNTLSIVLLCICANIFFH